jgi:hypothetical protein
MAKSANVAIVVCCESCGEMRLRPGAVTLRHCVDDETWTYWFVCPACHLRNAAPAEPEVSLAAIDAGSPLEQWHLPAELQEHSDRAPGLNGVDLLEFHLGLIEPDWIDELR